MSDAPMNRTRVAVVGAGTMGTMYLRALSQSARAVPVAVCDLDLARAQAVANEFGVEHTYRDQTEMQERHELDAVVVATPDAHHRGPVLEALAHGAHVLCEKPLAVTVEDCLEMTQAAKSHGRRLMVNFGNRHRKEVRLVRQEIAEGALGVIGHAYMRLNERVDKTRTLGWTGSTSPTWFLHSHLVDLVCFVLGRDVEEVFGYQYVGRVARESETDVPDTAVYLLRMRSGAIVTLESSWRFPSRFPRTSTSSSPWSATRGCCVLRFRVAWRSTRRGTAPFAGILKLNGSTAWSRGGGSRPVSTSCTASDRHGTPPQRPGRYVRHQGIGGDVPVHILGGAGAARTLAARPQHAVGSTVPGGFSCQTNQPLIAARCRGDGLPAPTTTCRDHGSTRVGRCGGRWPDTVGGCLPSARPPRLGRRDWANGSARRLDSAYS